MSPFLFFSFFFFFSPLTPHPETLQIGGVSASVNSRRVLATSGRLLRFPGCGAAPHDRSANSGHDPDKIFTKVEIEASFPGGLQAWSRYVSRAITSHIDEFSESDYGTCVVRFIVDKTGTVSDVQATTMKGTKLAEVAVNAIRNGPKWVPAQQNGRYVNAYRLQPVTLQNPDQ